MGVFTFTSPKKSVAPASNQESSRELGLEWRAAIWACRHPGISLSSAALGTGLLELGPVTMAEVAGGAALGLGAWYRGHPNSYDRMAAPRLRASWRRWTSYAGRRWADACMAVDLAPVKRRTGITQIPRVLRVLSFSPSIDTVIIRMAPGQSVKAGRRKQKPSPTPWARSGSRSSEPSPARSAWSSNAPSRSPRSSTHLPCRPIRAWSTWARSTWARTSTALTGVSPWPVSTGSLPGPRVRVRRR